MSQKALIGLAVTAVTILVVVAIAARIEPVKKLVFGA